MQHASMEMSGSARSRAATRHEDLDRALAVLKEQARPFARLGPRERADLLRACVPTLEAVAEEWVAAAVKAKGIGREAAAEEWNAGPMTTMRNIRFLVRSLEQIAASGKPVLEPRRFGLARDGVTTVEVFPTDAADKVLLAGLSARVRFQPGIDATVARDRQASFYGRKDPEGGVSLVLGAGNVASIPPMDALYKMFVEGFVCLVKMNPVNEYLTPYFDRAFEPLIRRGFLKFVMGGAEEGSYLCYHAAVDDVHITGSDRTHDMIVWGPPGPERERRMAEDAPILTKPISSELGSVTPVVVVPAAYSDAELSYLAENVATMVANNASCNCNAGKMLVTSASWPQREDFLGRVRKVLARQTPRRAYYPGAVQRYESLLEGRDTVQRVGEGGGEGALPWALVFGLDGAGNDRLFTTEPFCPILSEATLAESDPVRFVEAATKFCNDTLWGTLSAVMIVHPSLEADAGFAQALDHAVATLRYGAVGINAWTGLVYGLVSPPWGAHPSSTPKNIQGGLGWVHNTYMLEGIEKLVLRAPVVMKPRPPFFVTHAKGLDVAKKLFAFETSPSWFKVPGIALSALSG